MSNIIFQGNVQVQLYGHNALAPLSLQDQVLTCAIGAESSELIITEHRNETIQIIKRASPNYPHKFIEVFNKLAWVEIRYTPHNKKLEIDLFEASKEIMETPILWMGMLGNNLMPAYEVEWEVLKTVDENNIAFCALVKTQPVLPSDQFSFASVSDEDAFSR